MQGTFGNIWVTFLIQHLVTLLASENHKIRKSIKKLLTIVDVIKLFWKKSRFHQIRICILKQTNKNRPF